MIRKFIFTLAASAASITLPVPAFAQSVAAEPAPVDPVRLSIAQGIAGQLIPPGTYQKIMKDISEQMASTMIDQMMGMDASTMMGSAGGDAAQSAQGKSVGELAAVGDPHFKERMDIMMRVMFDEMGKLMSEMEPVARDALARVYARRYSERQLTDMKAFFATPSGSAFAADFMATFSDPEMMQAMMGQMPKILEAMPAIMKKVEAATAHLPPLPKATKDEVTDVDWPKCVLDGNDSDCSADEKAQISAAQAKIGADTDPLNEIADGESADSPWYDQEKWTQADREKVDALGRELDALSAKSDAAYSAQDKAFEAWAAARAEAINNARKKLKTGK